jgi:hypothetical protein
MRGDPLRLQQREVDHVGAERNGLALHLVGGAGVVAQRRHHAVDVALGVLERLADVERLQPGQLVAMGGDEIRQLEHQGAALLRRHLAPGTLHRGVGGAHGAVDILGAGARDLGDRFLGRGIDGREIRTGTGGDPFVVDEEFVFHESFSTAEFAPLNCRGTETRRIHREEKGDTDEHR